jgi:hypothetical protein
MIYFVVLPGQDLADPSAISNTTSASLIRAATVERVWIEWANSSASARLATLDHVARPR